MEWRDVETEVTRLVSAFQSDAMKYDCYFMRVHGVPPFPIYERDHFVFIM